MRTKRKCTIFYVGWNHKGFVCEQPFYTKKSAIEHGVSCDYEGNGIFLVEVPATITPVFSKSTCRPHPAAEFKRKPAHEERV